MDRYLSVIKSEQFWALEGAYVQYTEKNKLSKIENPAAYLNGIIQRIVIQKARDEVGKRL